MKAFKRMHFSISDFIFLSSLFLANLRASFFFPLFPDTSLSPLGLAWVEILLWLALVFAAGLHLARRKLFSQYWQTGRRQIVVVIFVLFSFSSLFWSISPPSSLFRWLAFFLATLLAVYFAMIYGLQRMLLLLAWGGLIMTLLSIFTALLLPGFGVSDGFPYYGAWRGVFWNRNHLGTLMSMFNIVYLFLMVHYFLKDRPQSVFWGVSYLLTLALVLFSKSATALVVTVLLNSAFLLLLIWLKIRHLLTGKHYYALAGIFLVSIIALFINLDFLFGLLGRDSSLTGRIDLWQYLLQDVVSKHPLFGYGFGAIWNIRSFRVETASRIGWAFPVLIGDNGFMDILLHLGVIGLVIFLGILIAGYVRALKIIRSQIGILSFFPLFVLTYAILVNLSFSLFMETEFLVWMVVIQSAFNNHEDISI